MTKRELIVSLARDPIAIQRASTRCSYRIAPHADLDPRNGMWIALALTRYEPLWEGGSQTVRSITDRCEDSRE